MLDPQSLKKNNAEPIRYSHKTDQKSHVFQNNDKAEKRPNRLLEVKFLENQDFDKMVHETTRPTAQDKVSKSLVFGQKGTGLAII